MEHRQMVVVNGAEGPPPPPPPHNLRGRNLLNGRLRDLMIQAIENRIDVLAALQELLREQLDNAQIGRDILWVFLVFQIILGELAALRNIVNLLYNAGATSNYDSRITGLENRVLRLEARVRRLHLIVGGTLIVGTIFVLAVVLDNGEALNQAAEVFLQLLRRGQ